MAHALVLFCGPKQMAFSCYWLASIVKAQPAAPSARCTTRRGVYSGLKTGTKQHQKALPSNLIDRRENFLETMLGGKYGSLGTAGCPGFCSFLVHMSKQAPSKPWLWHAGLRTQLQNSFLLTWRVGVGNLSAEVVLTAHLTAISSHTSLSLSFVSSHIWFGNDFPQKRLQMLNW